MKKLKMIITFIITFVIAICIFNSFSFAYNEGDERVWSLKDMENLKNLYCLDHGREAPIGEGVSYRAKASIKLKGNTATYGSNTITHDSNGILSALLASGSISKGYGKYSVDDHSEAQFGLWTFWVDWMNDVGYNLGLSSEVTPSEKYDRKGKGTEAVTKATQLKSDENEVTITIFLSNVDTGDWQMLLYAEPQTPPEDDPHKGEHNGKITITGNVWEDAFSGKANDIDGLFTTNGTDKPLKGVHVVWYDRYTNKIGETYTNDNGYYEISATIKMRDHTYYLADSDYDSFNKGTYVEFTYNGVKYTTVATGSASNASKATENKTNRQTLDNKFKEITNKGVMDGSNKAFDLNYKRGTINNLSTSTLVQGIMDFPTTANTNTLDNLLDNADQKGNYNFCVKYCPGDGTHKIGGDDYQLIPIGASLGYDTSDGNRYFNVNGSFCPINSAEGTAYWQEQMAQGNEPDVYVKGQKGCSSPHHEYEDRVDSWRINNINLGLVQREQPDIALGSDIEAVRIIMNNQEFTYIYNKRGLAQMSNIEHYKVEFGTKYQRTYQRAVNPAQVSANAQGASTIEVYVTYNIAVTNQSNTLPVEVGEIVNYYDSTHYEKVNAAWIESTAGVIKNGVFQEDRSKAITCATTSKYGQTYSDSNGYKGLYINALKGVKLAPNARSQFINIEFKVKEDAIKQLLNHEDILLKNHSEINAYASFYGDSTMCAEQKTAKVLGKTNTLYAGVDLDSAPGNATPTDNMQNYEDDTDQAPVFKITKDSYKMLSGTVWEDTPTSQSLKNKERLGDGTKANNEKGVKGVKVELFKKVNNTIEPAQLYWIENGQAKTEPAITYTDENGNYSFGNNNSAKGTVKGIITDDKEYFIQFTYGGEIDGSKTSISGTTPIDARNYKSTIINKNDNAVAYTVAQGKKTSYGDKWYLNIKDNASIALDDINIRKAIDTSIQYNNFETVGTMKATTPSFKIDVEFTNENSSQVDDKGGQFVKDWARMDFGIIERPREDLVINKTIENLKITLGNGQVLMEGNPYAEKMNYVKALGNTINSRNDFKKAQEKLISIEMDTELIQSATLDILYAITVTNNSEIDYNYDYGTGYYYYGENKGLPLVKSAAEYIAEYLDSELTCSLENDINKNWIQVKAEALKDQGYISDKTLETLKANNYTIFITNVFKDIEIGKSHTEKLVTSKLLANQGNDYTYENHSEIIKIGGKIARTIDSTNNGEQVIKTYKPGNYIPSTQRTSTNSNGSLEQLGLHQQDDDMITVRITPPTGLADNIIIYIISGVIALAILSIGIYVIKNKVVSK